MKEQFERLEQRRARQLAREYEKRGYEVIVGPKREQLPRFFGSYRPDLIATKKNQQVAVEVKSRRSLSSSKQLAEIAKSIEQHPNWRLELVVTNPTDVEDEVGSYLDVGISKRWLADARDLFRQKKDEAAILIGWSAAEAALRTIALNENVPHKQGGIGYLLKLLYSRGLVNRGDFQILDEIGNIRSHIAHGFVVPRINRNKVSKFFQAISHLIGSAE
jgi:hypothetical protein